MNAITSHSILLISILVVIAFVFMCWLMSRYRRCPSDKVLVVYGSNKGGSVAKCVHGGGTFVWPVIQDYAYLSLRPISIEANLTNALSRQNIRVDVPCRFTVGISTEEDLMHNAAERLLGMADNEIQETARDILFGQVRLVIASMSIEELNSDRDKFQESIMKNVEMELRKIGLRLINVNVTDIKDESGYIEALGQEAAATAINAAKVKVAEQEKFGEIGRAEAERETRIQIASANAKAVAGENEAKAAIAKSDADRRELEAEAQRRATVAEKIAASKAMEDAYNAQKQAELSRAECERAKQQASIIVNQEIERQRQIIAAEAEAAIKLQRAKAEAEALFAKAEAESRGLNEMLTKQAEGFEKMIAAAGGDPDKAYQLMLIDKLPELIKIQVEAIKGLNIDKLTVWDGGSMNEEGKTTTANFVSGLMKSIPPLGELFDQAGMNLPSYLGSKKQMSDASAKTTEAEHNFNLGSTKTDSKKA